MIHLENIQKIYQTRNIETIALNQINLHVKKGEFVSVMGPSGCGKSTLLNIIGLLDHPTEGHVHIDNTLIGDQKDKKLAHIRNEKVGFIFQRFHLINSLNVVDNVELPLMYRKLSSSARHKLAKENLERVGLSHRMKHFPSELSGGQCQRVAIARAIAGSPQILLADEPTGNLDSQMGHDIMEILHQLNKESKMTIVMVTHDENLARQTNRIIRFFDGRQVN
ncbi:MAG: ABC transporter ATP-binding protein [Bacteroidales bacterium]|jgi:putative ABC transport system ATP-binding protein